MRVFQRPMSGPTVRSLLVLLLLLAVPVTSAAADESDPPDVETRGLTGEPTHPPVPVADSVDETGRTLAVPRGARGVEGKDVGTEATTDPAWGLIQEVPVFQRLAVGDRFAVQLDYGTESLVELPGTDPLTTLARQAVDRAPTWLQKQLEDALSRMSAGQQDSWAQMVLDAVDPYVDEVAFLVAHVSRTDLVNLQFYAQLITDSSDFAYEADPYLDYVEVVDHGSAGEGGDYYTTLRYDVELDGVVSSVEYPRETYYWYVVHPRGSDEFPTYIDPVPCSSGGSPAAPPTGKFWREWFFHGADNKHGGLCDTQWDGTPDDPCPVLKDMLAGVPVLWSHLRNTNGIANGAVGVVNDWIRKSLGTFGDKDSCRPVQPVTVYYHNDGNCGEWADLTMAAGRAALIPTEVTGTQVNDHVWNEFYDEQWGRWVQWEPVNNMIDASYAGWWGGRLAATHTPRGDGYGHTERTADHGPSATLTVTVYDASHYPVDGALVVLSSEWDPFPAFAMSASHGHTDAEGKILFTLGDDRNFYVSVTTPWGRYPSSGSALVVENSQGGMDYFWSPPDFAGLVPRPEVTDLGPPSGLDDYLLEAEFAIAEGYVHGESFSGSIQYGKSWPGDLDSFVVDDANWSAFTSGSPFDAWSIALDDGGREASFLPPVVDDYYFVWSNRASMDMAHVVDGAVRLYGNTGAVPGVFQLGVDKDGAAASLLDWEDVVGQNVDGYNVYRSSSPADVGEGRGEAELDPYLVASPSLSEHRDETAAAPGVCLCYSVRTRSSRGGISP
jgi:hypothetical protein